MLNFDKRPWGTWEEYINQPGYRVKRIIVEPGKRISLQRHQKRSEHWVVVSGHGLATIGEQETQINPNDSVYIPLGAIHRLSNPGKDDLIVIETQFGECVESDIIRIEDDFGRRTTDRG